LESGRNSNTYDFRLLKSSKNSSFKIGNNIEPQLFHDIFETIKPYLKQNELVDLHDNYDNVKCYLSEDGLQGFAIEENGNLISVFNADINKRGFVEAISDYVKENGATHLDCYGYLVNYYNRVLGFKTASLMDYNMKYDHDKIAENHNMPQVAFMVNTNENVETKHFNKDQYDEAQQYQLSFIEKNNSSFSKSKIVDDYGKEYKTLKKKLQNTNVVNGNGNIQRFYEDEDASYLISGKEFISNEISEGKSYNKQVYINDKTPLFVDTFGSDYYEDNITISGVDFIKEGTYSLDDIVEAFNKQSKYDTLILKNLLVHKDTNDYSIDVAISKNISNEFETNFEEIEMPKIEEIKENNKNIGKNYSINAVYHDEKLTNDNRNELIDKSSKQFFKANDLFTKLVGIKTKSISENIGGYQVQEGSLKGETITELSYSFEFDRGTNFENVVLYSCLMGDLAYEQQEAVIAAEYVKKDKANAIEYTLKINDIEKALKSITDIGFEDGFTLSRDKKEIILNQFDFFTEEQVKNFENKLNKLIKILKKEDNFNGTEKNNIYSRYLGKEDRRNVYKEWLGTSKTREQSRVLYEIISQAIEKLEGREAKVDFDNLLSSEGVKETNQSNAPPFVKETQIEPFKVKLELPKTLDRDFIRNQATLINNSLLDENFDFTSINSKDREKLYDFLNEWIDTKTEYYSQLEQYAMNLCCFECKIN